MIKPNLKLLFIASAFASMVSCSSDSDPEPAGCDSSNLSLKVGEARNTSGCSVSDGEVTLAADGGEGSLEYSIDGVRFQAESTFSDLSAGSYTATVKDGNSCEATVSFILSASGSSLAITSLQVKTAGCDQSGGEIVVTASGEGELSYQLDDGAFQSSATFSGLVADTYSITVKDASNCQAVVQQEVLNGTSYEQQVKDIITTNCAVSGCHNGDNGSSRNWTVFANVQNNASSIKSRTQSGSMPPSSSGQSLTEQEKALIACWVNDGALDN